jgi:hypothetical protein
MHKQIELHQTNEELQRLQTLKKNLSNKYSVISADLTAEEAKRKKLEEEVSRANSRSGGLFKQLRENDELQGRLRTMENRLDKALVRYNRNLGLLSDLRARIDELRKDRRNFRGVMHLSDVSRTQKDSDMATLITESNNAYSKRDSRKMQLVKLRAAEKADVKNFEEKMARLNQTIEAQKLTQNRPIDQRPTEQQSDCQAGSQSEKQEEVTTLTEQYNTTIQRTMELCAMPSVPELFAEAEKLERENFSLYNYVVEHGAVQTRLQEEIDGLELQHQVLVAQTSASDEEQSALLDRLTQDIQKVDADLEEARQMKAANDAEFASAYVQIEGLFNLLGCPWDDAPDGKATATPQNSMFCLSAIESAIAEMMNALFEKTKLECGVKGIKPSSFLPEGVEIQPQVSTLLTKHPVAAATKSPERDSTAKVADAVKPLSIEELRALLD